MADMLGGFTYRRRMVVPVLALLCGMAAPGSLHAQARMDRATATFSGNKYVVQPGDMLRIQIYGWPEASSQMEGSFPVEATGVAYLPVIGPLNVAGKTADDVQQEFRKRFAVEQRNPVVTVHPLFAVSVMGEVRAPGVIDAAPGYTVFDAISTAGGFTEQANRHMVLVVRNKATIAVGGGNAQDAAIAMAQNPLESGDRVIVQRTTKPASNSIASILQATVSAATLVILLSRR